MITYKIDKQALAQANSEIRDMATVLAEIAGTLEILQNALAKHRSALSSPTIASFRDELDEMVNSAVRMANSITERSQKLYAVSDQAGKHLAAIEDHFGAVLRDRTPQIQAPVR